MRSISSDMPFNMADYVLTAGRRSPDKTALALVGGDREFRMTYSELEHSVRVTGHHLLTQGLTAGDRVILRLANDPNFPIAYLGAISVGIVPVATSAQLTQVEIDRLADLVDPVAVLHDQSLPVPTNLEHQINVSDISFDKSACRADFQFGDPHRPAYIVFTSGTSGVPRAVVHAHRVVLARQMMFDDWYGLRTDDRVMHAGAFNWTFTMGTGLIDPWTFGATSLIPHASVSPEELGTLMNGVDVSIFAAAPGVYRKLLKSDFERPETLRHGLAAGEKLPEATREQWLKRTGTHIHEAFGMSECSTFLSGAPRRPAPSNTIGYPQGGRRVNIRDDGMICIHKDDPGLMLGYFNAPEATVNKFDGQWFVTGDVGKQAADGAIEYLGRADDIMNAGGLRVSPLEVEAELATCAPMQEWACAEVRLKPDVSVIAAFYAGPDLINEDEVLVRLKQRLAKFKLPRIIARVDALPRGGNGKLMRKALRNQWEAEHGQT